MPNQSVGAFLGNTRRNLSLKWWESLDMEERTSRCGNYYTTDDAVNLSPGQIEFMYNIEHRPERILCAAIWFDDGTKHVHNCTNIETGIVLCGYRHSNIFAQTALKVMERRDLGVVKETQGFLTSKNRFVTRKEAAVIAKEQHQLIPPKTSVQELYSEDLY